jgi:hypothetical protein
LAIEKTWIASLFLAFGVYREILTGEKHPKAGLVCFLNIQGTTAQCTEATKLYQELLEKQFKLNGIVIGFYRTAAFVTSTIIELQQWNN